MIVAPAISRDLVGGVAFLAVGLLTIWLATDLDVGTLRLVGPGAMPIAVGVAMIGLAAALIVRAVRRPEAGVVEEEPPDTWGYARVAAVIVLIGLFILVLPVAGFLISSFALMYVFYAIGIGRPFSRFALVAAVVSSLAAYGLFVLILGVRLPAGILGGL
ncbi:MAG: tripartite tricarboxylate transporter TctB family protein [Rhodoplanes sp.]|uniref:tripartite tricarboxylate transporter TctB family protein n=1 Tax=Rhodoplanes sp. TaxID=1968906 RepID=UPI00184EA00E|nr:tripartite tricarboxylate transporter TctB family protein [Rhodoplanes sp.]NVO14964.1 tripartite tricarboxylate transporter TctB family protein [Rhodoplanes sp.]